MAQDKTTRTFSTLIKEYMPYSLMREELIKRSWFLSNTDVDQTFKGGKLYVPFQGAKASTIQYGKYAAAGSITQSQHVKASIDGYKEIWGSMIFNDSDLHEHDSLEKSFLKILPTELEQFIVSMKERVSLAFLNGAWLCRLTANSSSAGGVVVVDRPERLEIGQQVHIVSYEGTSFAAVQAGGLPNHTVGIAASTDASAPVSNVYTAAYIKSIDMNTNEVVIADGAGTPLDFSVGGQDLTVGTSAIRDQVRIFLVGAAVPSNQVLSLRQALLSAANSGSTLLYGQTKTAYPYLQALNFSGSAITTSNILEKIFDAQTKVRTVGKGNPSKVVMSDKNGAAVKKNLDVSRQFTAVDRKFNAFGWEEVTIGGSKGQLDIVIVNEIDNDIMPILDPSSWKVFSNGMFERRADPDGKEYFAVRGADGFQYLVDLRFFGDMIVHAPSYDGIIYDVNLP